MILKALILAAAALPLVAQSPFSRAGKEYSRSLAPYVVSPYAVVDKMLEVSNVKPGETLYDLGCADGRILVKAAQKYKAKAVGVEISETLVKAANENIRQHKLEDLARVIHDDLRNVNLEGADVVVLYLETGSNEMLRPKLEKSLKPGARVVSHDFEVRGWKPARVEKISAFNRSHTIYLYEMPPKR